MESITKHPEFAEWFEKCTNEPHQTGQTKSAIQLTFDAGGEAAQAILQLEINRLREVNNKLVDVLEKVQYRFKHDPKEQAMHFDIIKALELAEGPNK